MSFTNLWGEGGVTLRLETGDDGRGYAGNIKGSNITCVNGSSAFMAQPHCQANGAFHVTDLLSIGCNDAMHLSGGFVSLNKCCDNSSGTPTDCLPDGHYDNSSSISRVRTVYGTEAQVEDSSSTALPSCAACTIENAQLNYNVHISDVQTIGFPTPSQRDSCTFYHRCYGCVYEVGKSGPGFCEKPCGCPYYGRPNSTHLTTTSSEANAAVGAGATASKSIAVPPITASDEGSLRKALDMIRSLWKKEARRNHYTVHLHRPIAMRAPLILSEEHAGVELMRAPTATGPVGLYSHSVKYSEPGLFSKSSPVLQINGAHNVTVRGVTISFVESGKHAYNLSRLGLAAAALETRDAESVHLTDLIVVGGVRMEGGKNNILSWSDISNPFGSNGGGTCAHVASCGNATTLESCNTTVHDNNIHDCRAVSSPYDASAQGVLLGGAVAAKVCTVGVVVRNNNISRVDSFGMRVSNDNYYPCVNNQLVFNRVKEWGQGGQSYGHNGSTDASCMYMYGHWYSPGNNFSFNYCLQTSSHWGNNGMYLDDVATGQTIVGNVFQGVGNVIKMNGGSYNTIDSLIVINGSRLGFGNCRGLRGSTPADYYTCENPNAGRRWMPILESVNYLGPLWHARWPWYSGWCTNRTAGPHHSLCHPSGAPPEYECAVLSRGNTVARLAGVGMVRNDSFAFQTAPGFPAGTGMCPEFVVNNSFNAVNIAPEPFFDLDQFVDFAGGDLTLRADSDVYASMPDFRRIPFNRIGIGANGKA
eukprot:COSAG02_NODE_925_length_15858_cov_4.267276_14_plen_758_part_00